MTTTIENLVGQKFGRWTLVRFVENRKDSHGRRQGQFWECKCDCGVVKIIRLGGIKAGQSKSCGCLLKDVGKRRSLPAGESAFRTLYARYKTRAKERGFIFELSKDKFKELTQQDCYYCGVKPGHFHRSKTNGYVYNGIDRVDNSRGYSPDNVVPCCGPCNRMKMTTPIDEFLDRIHRIAARRDND